LSLPLELEISQTRKLFLKNYLKRETGSGGQVLGVAKSLFLKKEGGVRIILRFEFVL
jgi:hypothetical protein